MDQRSDADKNVSVSCTHGQRSLGKLNVHMQVDEGRTMHVEELQMSTKEEIWILDSTRGKGKIAIVRRLEAASQRVES